MSMDFLGWARYVPGIQSVWKGVAGQVGSTVQGHISSQKALSCVVLVAVHACWPPCGCGRIDMGVLCPCHGCIQCEASWGQQAGGTCVSYTTQHEPAVGAKQYHHSGHLFI